MNYCLIKHRPKSALVCYDLIEAESNCALARVSSKLPIARITRGKVKQPQLSAVGREIFMAEESAYFPGSFRSLKERVGPKGAWVNVGPRML